MNHYLPKISVVMSVYNGAKYLSKAIESILNQTFKDFEFIIINDGSKDKSQNIIKSYKDKRIKLFSHENQGLAKSLNYGISKSRGMYIARMDADDICYLQRLEKQLSFLENNQQCVALGTNADIIDEEDKFVYTSNLEIDWLKIKENLPSIPFYHSSVLFRKKIFVAVGGYPENMLRGQDAVLFNKMAKFGRLLNLEDVLIKYRLVPTALSINKSKKASRFLTKLIVKSINDQDLTEKEVFEFKKMVFKNRISSNKYRYYILLSKKYLWNNYQPKLARKNMKKSLKYAPYNPEILILFFLSIFPRNFMLKIYNKIKK